MSRGLERVYLVHKANEIAKVVWTGGKVVIRVENGVSSAKMMCRRESGNELGRARRRKKGRTLLVEELGRNAGSMLDQL